MLAQCPGSYINVQETGCPGTSCRIDLFRALPKPDDSGFRGFGEAWIGRRLDQVLFFLAPATFCTHLLPMVRCPAVDDDTARIPGNPLRIPTMNRCLAQPVLNQILKNAGVPLPTR
jgi:hypothetical protein